MRQLPIFVLAALFGLGSLACPAAASAQGELASVGELHRACRASERPGRRQLHVLTVHSGDWQFSRYMRGDRFLPVDTHRNLRALNGSVELFTAGFETVGFGARGDRVQELRTAAEAGAHLRVGFFLAFENLSRRACLIRGATVGVTAVRIDLAFSELVDAEGAVLAREDSERYRAWADDDEADGVEGEGPRGAVFPAMISGGAGVAPEPWQRTLEAANQGPLRAALASCHAAAVERGASESAQIVVRLTVDPRSGSIRGREVELSSLADAEGATCVGAALATHLRFPSVGEHQTRAIELSVPVRLRAD